MITEMQCVKARERAELAAVGQFLHGVGMCRLEQPIAARGTRRIGDHERFVHELGDSSDGFPFRERRVRHDAGGGFQAEAAREHGQPPQHDAIGLGEQPMAPIESRAQRLVARQRRTAAAGEDVKPQIQSAGEPFYPERRRARGCKLDGERYAVEAAADGHDGSGVALAQVEMRVGGAGARDEEPHRIVAQRGREFRRLLGGKLQRAQAIGAFPVETERLLTGGEDAGARHGAQQRLRFPRRRADHVLAVVEHQQEPTPAQCRGEPLRGPAAGAALQAQGRVDGARDQLGIGQGRELRKPDTIGKLLEHRPRGLEPEPRLADTPGADHGHEAVVAQELAQLPQLRLAADEIRHRRRQVGWRLPRRLGSGTRRR